MNLARLLTIHSIVTFAAGVVLMAAPGFIPSTVGINVEPKAYLICYLLGAAELGLAFLSYFSIGIKDANALRVIVWTFIVFHTSSAVVEILAYVQGLSAAIWGNIAIRIVVVTLFAYYGPYKISHKASAE